MNENDNLEAQEDDNVSKEIVENISDFIISAPKVDIIPFSLVKRHDKKTVQLLSNSNNNIKSISGKSVWHIYEFKEDIFLEQISIKVQDYSESSPFEIYCVDYNGKRLERTLTPRTC